MPDASSSPSEQPPRSRRATRVGSFALCPVCEGMGHVQLVDGCWGSCAVCVERGFVPAAVAPAIALLPCEGCLGRGEWWTGELCSLCGGTGLLPIDLGGREGERRAA